MSETITYKTCGCVCNPLDWMGSTLHIPAQPYQGGELREQRIIARDLPADMLDIFKRALTGLLALAPGEWSAKIITIERRETALHLSISRQTGGVTLETHTHELRGDDYLTFFDRLTSPEFLISPSTKTI